MKMVANFHRKNIHLLIIKMNMTLVMLKEKMVQKEEEGGLRRSRRRLENSLKKVFLVAR